MSGPLVTFRIQKATVGYYDILQRLAKLDQTTTNDLLNQAIRDFVTKRVKQPDLDASEALAKRGTGTLVQTALDLLQEQRRRR